MILEVIRIIFGLLFSLFIPGFFLTSLFFKELNITEKIGMSIVLSIAIDIIIGILLGYNLAIKNWTGGITPENTWVSLIMISLALVTLYVRQKVNSLRI